VRINIVGEKQIAYAMEVVSKLPTDKGMVVEITKQKDRRSVAQNRLYWSWVTELAGEDGLTKEEEHLILKKRILAPLFIRDDIKGFAQTVTLIREVWRSGLSEKAQHLYDGVCQWISTRDCSVELFSEYLDDIEKDAMSRGIILTRPEDLYRDAMGH